jgi:hypothetical protein
MSDNSLGKNIDLYVTVVIAFAVSVLGVLGVVNLSVLVSATLATLALTTIGSFVSRRYVSNLATAIAELSTLMRRRELSSASADRMLSRSMSGLDIELPEIKDVRLVGVTLSRTVRNHMAALEGILLAGGSVCIGIIEPRGEVLAEAARRSTIADSPEIFENRLRSTFDLVRQLVAIPNAKSRVEMRLLRFVPAFGLTVLDPDGEAGRIYVDIYSHRPAGTEPVLTLLRYRDPRWYQHFLSEFERIWADGRIAALDELS